MQTVFTFDQWSNIVESARKKNPFEVIRMANKFTDVKALTETRKFCNSKTNATEKFNFIKLR